MNSVGSSVVRLGVGACLCVTGVALSLSAIAEERTFPTTSGDLASAAAWGGTVPGQDDCVNVSPGTYSFGGDVSFGRINLSAIGTHSFDATGRTVSLFTSQHQIDLFNSREKGLTANLTGGTWDFKGNEFRGMEGKASLNLFGGAKIVNAGTFYAKYYASGDMSVLYMTGASQLDCGAFYCTYKDLGNVTVSVVGGSKLNASSLSIARGGHNYVYFNINNGGQVTTTGNVTLGEGGGGLSNQLLMDGGTLVIGGNFKIPCNNTAGRNSGIRAIDSTITVSGDFDLSEACQAFADFQDVDFTVGGKFNFFQQYWSNSRVRFAGAKGTQPTGSKFTADVFGASGCNRNQLVVDDHFRFEQGDSWVQLMGFANDCALIVTNHATYVAPGGVRIGSSGSSYVSGSNSVVKIVDHATFQSGAGFGFQVPSGGKLIINGGSSLTAQGNVEFGNECRGYTVSISDSSLSTEGDLSVAYTSKANNGNVVAISNSTIQCKNVTFYGINGGFSDFQNVVFTLKPDGRWNGDNAKLFDGWFGKATLRLGGRSGNCPWGTSMANLYGSAPYCTLILDDGFCFTNNANQKMLINNHHCKLRVSNEASYISGSSTCIGHSDYSTSVSNEIEIVDGGRLEATQFFLMGTANTLVVSNGILRGASDVGFGYAPSEAKNPTTGSRVLVAGATPLVESASLWLCNGNELTMAIPAEGYADGHVPVVAGTVVFHTSAKLKLDCADYLAGQAGDVTLMTFSSDVGGRVSSDNSAKTFREWIRTQNASLGLPPGVPGLRLVRNGAGSKLVFRKVPVGFMLFVR